MFRTKTNSFKGSKTFEERQKESSEILTKYPDKIPIIVEKHPNSKIVGFDQRKFLINSQLRVYQLMVLVRNKMNLNKTDSLYLFINSKELLKTDTLISEAYSKYKDDDGFLYVTYNEYNSFGN